jgi:hypothetical protein
MQIPSTSKADRAFLICNSEDFASLESAPLSLERGVHVLIEIISAMMDAKAIGVDGIGMDGHEERCEHQEQKGRVTKTILITVYGS